MDRKCARVSSNERLFRVSPPAWEGKQLLFSTINPYKSGHERSMDVPLRRQPSGRHVRSERMSLVQLEKPEDSAASPHFTQNIFLTGWKSWRKCPEDVNEFGKHARRSYSPFKWVREHEGEDGGRLDIVTETNTVSAEWADSWKGITWKKLETKAQAVSWWVREQRQATGERKLWFNNFVHLFWIIINEQLMNLVLIFPLSGVFKGCLTIRYEGSNFNVWLLNHNQTPVVCEHAQGLKISNFCPLRNLTAFLSKFWQIQSVYLFLMRRFAWSCSSDPDADFHCVTSRGGRSRTASWEL